MSFFAQLLPGINWGLVAVVLIPKDLQKYYQDLYYKMLNRVEADNCPPQESRGRRITKPNP